MRRVSHRRAGREESAAVSYETSREPGRTPGEIRGMLDRRAGQVRRSEGMTDRDEATLGSALRETSRALTDQADPASSPEDLASRLCGFLLEHVPCSDAHTYLRSTDGDFVHVAQESKGPLHAALRERFALFEVEELLGSLDDHPTATGRAGEARHPFASRLASRMSLAWVLVAPLRSEGRTIGLQIVGGPTPGGPPERTKQIVEEAARVAGLAVGGALLRAEVSRLERTRSEILSMVSHELRSPLHVILGYEGLLREGGLGELSNEQHDALVRIGRNARQLAGLIENTLTAAQDDAQQLPSGMREIRPCDVTIDIQDEMTALYGDRDLDLVWDVPENLPRLYTDPEKLKLVLRNLVSNAVKFTDSGTVRVTAERRAGGLAILVADTGVGIAPDQLDAIFEEFRQVPSEDRGEREGVGLGLYIVQRMTEKLEGSISVESTPGEGSAFTLWLPLRVGAVHAVASRRS